MGIVYEKKRAALAALKHIESGMTIGLGSGSTAHHFIEHLGKNVRDKVVSDLYCVPTSSTSANLAKKVGLTVVDFEKLAQIDVTVDGADEFDPYLSLIKGGGGALVREKIVASLSNKFIVITDSSKKVNTLGAFKLPVEVFQFAQAPIIERLKSLGFKPFLRKSPTGEIFISDNGNYIVDLDLKKITNPYQLKQQLENIPGIIDHGLFLNYADLVLMGSGKDVITFKAN